MTIRATHPQANRVVRILGGFLLLLAGANLLLLPRFGWSEASIMVVGGLFMLLFPPEATNDERVQSLKLKAISWGYAAGALGTLVYEGFAGSVPASHASNTAHMFEPRWDARNPRFIFLFRLGRRGSTLGRSDIYV